MRFYHSTEVIINYNLHVLTLTYRGEQKKIIYDILSTKPTNPTRSTPNIRGIYENVMNTIK